MQDSKIIDLYWKRDQQAIAASSEKYGAYCFAVAKSILSMDQDCEECVNDTWLGAWNTIPPHRPMVLRMFFAKITRSRAFDRFKKQNAKKRGAGEINAILDELAECLAGGESVEQTVDRRALDKAIETFVRSLSERDGNVFIRRYFFAETTAQIADRYDLTQNNVLVILSRTRQKLKQHLMKEGYLHE